MIPCSDTVAMNFLFFNKLDKNTKVAAPTLESDTGQKQKLLTFGTP